MGDDCSTDGTASIVADFVEKYPDLIKCVSQSQNVGPFNNYKIVHKKALGQYVSHIDGDDYMLPGKLQRQVDRLESNEQLSMVAHRMLLSRDEVIVGRTGAQPSQIDLEWLLLHHPGFLNSSMMYRRSYAGDLFSKEENFIDFYVYVHFAKRGAIAFVNEDLGVYRTFVGISSGMKLMPEIQSAISFARDSVGDSRVIARARYRQYRSYAMAAIRAGRTKDSLYFCDGMARYGSRVSERIISILMRRAPRLLHLFYAMYQLARSWRV